MLLKGVNILMSLESMDNLLVISKRTITAPLQVSMHKVDAIGDFPHMVLLGKEKNANINDGPHTLPSNQQRTLINGHQITLCLKNGLTY
jgi:hypothetical protein